jgi:alpha-galactosidase
VLNILDRQDSIRQYAGPGHWNDPDMLEVGNGMTYTQDKAHFSLWCMLAAPLMAGNDLRKMSPQITGILTNKEMIAIDQDPLGIECFKYYSFDGLEIFVKPLANNELAVCFLNRSKRTQMINYDWKDHAITDDFSKINIDFNQTTYKLRDIWAKKDIGTTDKAVKLAIAPNDVVVLRLTK